MSLRPVSELSTRPLHFIWIIDCSSAMKGPKIQAVNNAIREVIPDLRDRAQANPRARVLARCLKYANDAQWHIPQATPIEVFQWIDVATGGSSNMGKALLVLADELKMPPMDERGLPPVLVLVSGSPSTDKVSVGLKSLMDVPWGRKATRLAVGIGGDADYDTLQKFIGNPEIKPFQASNMEAIVAYIKWASEPMLSSGSAPASVLVPSPPIAPRLTRTIKIFFSYAHKDEPQLRVLQNHLSPLKHQGMITDWHDRDINAGAHREYEISQHLDAADIILLLISPDFMASHYCYSNEMMQALERHRLGKVRVIPIILRPVLWEGTLIGKLQVLPTGNKPIASWRKPDDAFRNVAQGIQEVVKELISRALDEPGSDSVW